MGALASAVRRGARPQRACFLLRTADSRAQDLENPERKLEDAAGRGEAARSAKAKASVAVSEKARRAF